MEESESEKERKLRKSKERSSSPDVKSTAVVKYTAYLNPVSYSRLQCNTDLNLPPSNWGVPFDSYGLQEILTSGSGLSSFRMAHMFPDCVGDVDVISSAECIKKLLKLPYHPKGTVSMVVHRLDNTLLLDEFHIYDYLTKSEWSWLKDFFYENILKTVSEQEQLRLTLAPPPTAALQLTHKFLSHSVTAPPARADAAPVACIAGPFLPEPEVRTDEPSPEHTYNQNVLWTFEDIHMLIGSDLPIFGNSDRPCVSLRLRDAREPINVLTGIDFWLDNLMCNVPEVLMCYHLDGIVQKYEPMKTEDIPHMESSRFSPKVIRNVAQNILSFLKSNATKAGHTYWLFKGPDDEVVKLYDLTSLCPDDLDHPYTTPVAMLLYRVARNLRLTNKTRHVRNLLENALSLLKVERYPHIVASSHYMLADLYVPATTNPACPNFKEESSDSDHEGEFEEARCERDSETESAESERESASLLPVGRRDLSLGNIGERAGPMPKKTVPNKGLGSDVPARCGKALQHALKGLEALHHVTIEKSKQEEKERVKQQIINEERSPKMANPFKPIKMGYEPINKRDSEDAKETPNRNRRKKRERRVSEKTEKSENYLIESKSKIDSNAILVRREKKQFPKWPDPPRDDNFAWKLHLKTLLYEKICLAYAILAEYSYTHGQYGFSLKYIDLTCKCQKLLTSMIIKSRVVEASCLVGRAGDNYYQLSKQWDKLEQCKRQFVSNHKVDLKIRAEIENDMVEEAEETCCDDFDLDVRLPTSPLGCVQLSLACYERAARGARGRHAELRRRQASVQNELAVRFMNEAQEVYFHYTKEKDPSKMEELKKSFLRSSDLSLKYLDQAASIFKSVDDVPNLALLNCNKSRFLRFRTFLDNHGFTPSVKKIYNEAEELYHSALRQLGPREGCGATKVWDLVWWELSSHLYNKAVLLQECGATHFKDPVNEISTALQQALKHCLLSPGERQHLYQLRAAMLNQKLGALFSTQFCKTKEDGPKRRAMFNLARKHYEAAANLFAAVEDAAGYIGAQVDNACLHDTYASVNPNVSLKTWQTAIQIIMQCQSMVKVMRERRLEEERALAEAVKKKEGRGKKKNSKDKKSQKASESREKVHREYINKNLQKEERKEKDDSQNEKDDLHKENLEKNDNEATNNPKTTEDVVKEEPQSQAKAKSEDVIADDTSETLLTPERLKKKIENEMEDEKAKLKREVNNEINLLTTIQFNLHSILKSIIKYCRSKPNKDFEKIGDTYKKLYLISLKIVKSDHSSSEFASSVLEVLEQMKHQLGEGE